MKVEKDEHQKKLEKFQKGLEEEWRVMVLSKSADQKKDLLKEVAINNVQLKAAQDMDIDLAQKKDAAKEANAIYAEGFKINKLKLSFIVECLKSDGVDIPDAVDFLSASAKAAMKEAG
jgi:hypothetical protein